MISYYSDFEISDDNLNRFEKLLYDCENLLEVFEVMKKIFALLMEKVMDRLKYF